MSDVSLLHKSFVAYLD